MLSSKPRLQHSLDCFIMPTSSTRPHLPKCEAVLSGPNELHTSSGFLSLARELRDIIYGDLITSGNVGILRVSQQVHDEAKDLLYRLGICRVHFSCENSLNNRPSYLRVFFPPKTSPNTVQNFNLKIGLDGCPYEDERLDPYLRAFVQGSGDCHVTLVAKCYSSFRVPLPAYCLIKSLTSFRLVTVRIYVIYHFHPMDRRNKRLVEPGHTQNLQSLATEVSAALGDPIWKIDTYPGNDYEMLAHERLNPFPNAQYLEFYPRKDTRLSAEPIISLPRVENTLEDNANV